MTCPGGEGRVATHGGRMGRVLLLCSQKTLASHNPDQCTPPTSRSSSQQQPFVVLGPLPHPRRLLSACPHIRPHASHKQQ